MDQVVPHYNSTSCVIGTEATVSSHSPTVATICQFIQIIIDQQVTDQQGQPAQPANHKLRYG